MEMVVHLVMDWHRDGALVREKHRVSNGYGDRDWEKEKHRVSNGYGDRDRNMDMERDMDMPMELSTINNSGDGKGTASGNDWKIGIGGLYGFGDGYASGISWFGEGNASGDGYALGSGSGKRYGKVSWKEYPDGREVR